MSRTKLILHRIALRCSPERFGKPAITNDLADLLYARFQEQGRISDLDEALALYRNALELSSNGKLDRALLLGNIANCLHARAAQFGTLADLDEALTLYRNTLESLPRDHPDRVLSLTGIASCLHFRFTRLGILSDLDQSLALRREILEIRPQGHPDRAPSFVTLASYLYLRFTHRGTLSDLEEALAFEREALELRPQGHPDRPHSLSNIANYLHSRFTQLGTLSDLDEALSFERDVLKHYPKEQPDQAVAMSTIASSLHIRFTQLGTLSDLDEALALERDAMRTLGRRDPRRTLSMTNVTNLLYARFKHLGMTSDLDEALALGRDMLGIYPPDHPRRAISRSNVANHLHARFKRLGIMSDLEDALAFYRETLGLLPQGHPHRALALVNIANCLYARSTRLGTLSDLNEAIALAHDALELNPRGHPDWSSSLGVLAQCLHARFKLSDMRETKDLEETFNVYSQLSTISQAASFADLQCAKQWIQAAEECEHATTVLAYQTCLRFSTQHLATLVSLPHHVVQLKRLTASITFDAFSACVRHGHLASAVELLEQGRDAFWSRLFHVYSPLDEVIASGDVGRELADMFIQLTSLLRNCLGAFPNPEFEHDRACRFNNQLQDVVAEIRKSPGLSHFLHPLLFSELQTVAGRGPIIIVNASQYGCDAIIVFPDKQPIHVPLLITKSRVSELSLQLHSLTSSSRSRSVSTDILVLLRELWDIVVSPIVEILQKHCPPGSRIWWCPTAEFSLLPLHAAGSYREGQSILSDLYISSYTPTLTALLRARQKRSPNLSEGGQRFLFVGHVQPPGQNELASVDSELYTISQRVGSIAALTCIQHQDADVAKIAERLNKNEFVHLSCHGITNRSHPFQSGFALRDGVLKVEDILRHGWQSARLAYLSACQAIVIKGDNSQDEPEVIHLAVAMQFAGFRSVIGTMWKTEDACANEITSEFYLHMTDGSGRLDHTRAALALHRTMRSIRSSDIPLDQQILYFHVGA